ncbi:MAG: hypothetical protein A2655_04115 [Candidatus Yanofskybacteria bacterium RIFCSPHIGHO2_01_FULL_43_42]|uniref:Uncharacterized protein n=1 Tax=Candidatus Yanofskybacteria bacterium RIFCSPLOWO2_01_FULL_43_22 TaxID=1802695 RepID=A0A1F8GDD8_9BACT|nr:MAG: hypothetical protein A2655_04115 [Candidatus Yanofskybacteria bacterium RIFCSPHIGHO2_01_FULL_43_42]OGN12678.1 MAG: hypothetical protein A3D48_01465 [Candidatus Yanofskybacteria bacterium RIFCSPHIGHO2_02_FULL_43_17]OGN23301.1 MAG: hypothetical protein A3A13_04235 [Candidatus Yanofskybacteria bacterium RIFCSPLOWO2_01_FULL_43_22]
MLIDEVRERVEVNKMRPRGCGAIGKDTGLVGMNGEANSAIGQRLNTVAVDVHFSKPQDVEHGHGNLSAGHGGRKDHHNWITQAFDCGTLSFQVLCENAMFVSVHD